MNLPTTYKINNIDSFYEKLFLDKKVKNQKIKFVIPNGIGNFVFKDNLSKTLLFDVLSEFQN
jgi:3-dehydroquinate synthase